MPAEIAREKIIQLCVPWLLLRSRRSQMIRMLRSSQHIVVVQPKHLLNIQSRKII